MIARMVVQLGDQLEIVCLGLPQSILRCDRQRAIEIRKGARRFAPLGVGNRELAKDVFLSDGIVNRGLSCVRALQPLDCPRRIADARLEPAKVIEGIALGPSVAGSGGCIA